jgi:hypothetical protein
LVAVDRQSGPRGIVGILDRVEEGPIGKFDEFSFYYRLRGHFELLGMLTSLAWQKKSREKNIAASSQLNRRHYPAGGSVLYNLIVILLSHFVNPTPLAATSFVTVLPLRV